MCLFEANCLIYSRAGQLQDSLQQLGWHLPNFHLYLGKTVTPREFCLCKHPDIWAVCTDICLRTEAWSGTSTDACLASV